jgi:hypothetical protein
VLLYGQYDAINRNIASFGEALADYKAAELGSATARDAQTMLLRILDVFNTGLDATLKRGQEVLSVIASIGGLKETEAEKAHIPNYQQVVAEHMAARQQHLDALQSRQPNGQAKE